MMKNNSLLAISNQYFRSILFNNKKEATEEGFSRKEQEEAVLMKILPASDALQERVLNKYGKVLSETGIRDLRLLEGGKNSPEASVLNKIDYTQTVVGKCVKATMLACPTNNLATIQNRQEAIKALQKKSVASKVDGALAHYKKVESDFLSHYTDRDSLKQPACQKNIRGFYFKRFGLGRFNQSAIALQLGKFWKDYWLHIGFGAKLIYAIVMLCKNGLSYQIGIEKISGTIFWGKYTIPGFFWDYCVDSMVLPGIGFWKWFSFFKDIWQGKIELSGIISLIIILHITYALVGVYFVYRAIKGYQRNKATLQCLAKRLLSFQHFFKSLEDLLLLDKEGEMPSAFSKKYLESTNLLLEAPADSELGLLVRHLKALRLDNWSYFFSPQGKLLATYHLLEKHKHQLADAIYELGQLDALRSVAILLPKAEEYSNKNHFVFTEFVPESSSPILKQEAMWHISLDATKVVTNNVFLQDDKTGTRMIVLTGPNAGGKSIYLQTMTLNLVLGQVFGIAASQSSRQTIFHKLVTYFDIVQDLSEGLSFFEAKVQGLEALTKTLASLSKGEFAFCMLDEPLSGTAEKIAEEAGYQVMEQLYTKNSHVLFIVVTHLEKLTELAVHQGCENKKVYVEMHGEKLHYTYKIMPGKSKADQNVAFHILKKRGLLGT